MVNSDCSNNFPFTNGTLSHLQQKVTVSILCILIPTIITANTILIYLLFKTKQIKLITNYFVLAMSISDTCTGAITLPFSIGHFNLLSSSKTTDAFLLFLVNLTVNFSALMVLVIAVNRCILIYHLKSNQIFLCHLKAKIIIAASFILSSGLATCAAWMFYTKHTKLLILGICIYGIFLLVSVVLLYIALYCKVRRTARTINVDRNNARNQSQGHAAFLTKTVTYIQLSLVCCYLPYLTMGMIIFFHSEGTCIDVILVKLFSVSVTLLYVYAAINACIITLRNRTMKSFILEKLQVLQNAREM